MADSARTAFAGGLPVELTRLVGREAELAEVAEALGRERLVTLMGVGGVGKTRIGLRVARRIRESFPAGVHFVELSGLRDPELLPNAVAAVVDLPEQTDAADAPDVPDASQLRTLISYFSDKQLLIVLDTCEHLADACAQFARAVLQSCPGVRILATSRRPLDAPGELLLQIPPLDAPDPDAERADAGRLGSPVTDAMELFVERAAAVARGFRLTDANRGQIARLCHRLDGIPLAIELAAVRVRALPLEEILRRLDNRFRLLTGGSRAALPRHQTLRTATDWSHELCSGPEQILWRRLSVFAGEFELTAAEQICAGEDLSEDDVLDCLIGLVDKAIVLRVESDDVYQSDAESHDVSESDGRARYRMLDTLREYGLERLQAAGEEHTYAARHRDHCLALAREFGLNWLTGAQAPRMRAMWRERPSLRSALEFCCADPREAAAGLEMATALWGLWLGMGRIVEGHYWLGRLLPLCPEPSPVRMRALCALGDLTLMTGHHRHGLALSDEAAGLAEAYDDRLALGYVAKNRGLYATLTGDAERALKHVTEARTLFAALGERDLEGWALATLCGAYAVSAQQEKSLELYDEAIALMDRCERWVQGWLRWQKGCSLWGLGRFDEAKQALSTTVVLCLEINHTQVLAFSIDTLAWVAAAEGRYAQAARCLGAAAKLWEKFHEPRLDIESMHEAHRAAWSETERALGVERCRQLLDEGAALPLQEAAAQAVAPTRASASAPRHTSAPAPAGNWEALTAREREIALLVAEGLSNRRIAEHLVISKRTVDSHLEHIMAKLGYGSRTQIASLVRSRGEP
ncbi:LuxR C-terminal-related transcriptional regulator [Streptomyces cavernicola]|uniref:LuxR C-terminal-related transcriptional regulator n=1 Tax=Streptomyces cavernicola TaxID=3043613 RepID=A0ABT6SBA0_9ACTN|nr:LuxR C-terminal-related transcriptional regulator [Streptomyces sp. B-S-A6]MDI3405225.1 LuxR C-terminal-related transcriptional regulator [Streptomyces sp. B-S-A6]